MFFLLLGLVEVAQDRHAAAERGDLRSVEVPIPVLLRAVILSQQLLDDLVRG
jgi:hypothetical protein